jgi:nucleoside-diphosphate-sugar epimerase
MNMHLDTLELSEQDPAILAISGASGYVGRALVNSFSGMNGWKINALRHSSLGSQNLPNVVDIQGDLLKAESLRQWPGMRSTVIHLAYMWSAGQDANLRATQNLIEACARAGVARLIHMSTAAVIGRAASTWVDEQTLCEPTTEYGQTKLRIEDVIRDGAQRYGFDLVILRPTSVYGPAGLPLQKLCSDLCLSPWTKNYLKSCLFGRRAMNLVHIDNVVAAVRFMAEYPHRFSGETYIVSEDEDVGNNFHDVEAAVRAEFDMGDYPLPLWSFPPWVLSHALRMLKRNIIDPHCRFSSKRIEALGFKAPRTFDDGLKDYLDWYQKMNRVKAHE